MYKYTFLIANFQQSFTIFTDMNNDFTYCIGLMSGTSLDGIDLVYVQFDKNNYSNFKIIASNTISYSDDWKQDLQKAISFSKDNLQQLDIAYGTLLGKHINFFIDENNIKIIDFIASHGHTVFHQPENGITLQIGNGQEIANCTRQKVVCDFRTQDVQLGGQGAPLVPIGDELLFRNYDFCVNLGGFANVSFKKGKKRIAFDVCPVNIVLNHYVNTLGFEYDDGGKIAASGTVNQELLKALNTLSFYKKNPPKSLGLEWVKEIIFPLINDLESDISTILRTFVEHAAQQIAKEIYQNNLVLVTGGGVFNSFLMSRIEYFSDSKIKMQTKELIDYKEALIFAFLGLLRIENKINCLQSVTGASKNHSSGLIFYP